MNERQERIEQLAERWTEARTTNAEEQELREALREDDLPDSLQDLALLFEGLEALGAERMPGELSAIRPSGETTSESAAGRVARGRIRMQQPRRRGLLWTIAAAAVVVLGLFLGIELLRDPYCYIDGRPVYDREEAMQTLAYFESFALLETPDRLLEELIDNQN